MTAFFNKSSTTFSKKVVLDKKITDLKKEAKKDSNGAVAVASPARSSNDSIAKKAGGLPLAMILIRPHVTEKATDLSVRGVYIFEINKLANKMYVQNAILALYKVKPTKIAIVNEKSKLMKNPRTGRTQTKKTGVKKALVYLKKGDKIEFV